MLPLFTAHVLTTGENATETTQCSGPCSGHRYPTLRLRPTTLSRTIASRRALYAWSSMGKCPRPPRSLEYTIYDVFIYLHGYITHFGISPIDCYVCISCFCSTARYANRKPTTTIREREIQRTQLTTGRRTRRIPRHSESCAPSSTSTTWIARVSAAMCSVQDRWS